MTDPLSRMPFIGEEWTKDERRLLQERGIRELSCGVLSKALEDAQFASMHYEIALFAESSWCDDLLSLLNIESDVYKRELERRMGERIGDVLRRGKKRPKAKRSPSEKRRAERKAKSFLSRSLSDRGEKSTEEVYRQYIEEAESEGYPSLGKRLFLKLALEIMPNLSLFEKRHPYRVVFIDRKRLPEIENSVSIFVDMLNSGEASIQSGEKKGIEAFRGTLSEDAYKAYRRTMGLYGVEGRITFRKKILTIYPQLRVVRTRRGISFA